MTSSSLEFPFAEDARRAERPTPPPSSSGARASRDAAPAIGPSSSTGRVGAALAALRPRFAELGGGLERLGARAVTGLALVVLLLAVGLLAFRAAYDERIYPAVYVAGRDLGGLTRAEARAVVEARAADVERGLVTFSYQGEIWTPSLTELGVRVDAEATLDAAFAVGREPNPADRLGATGLLVHRDRTVPLVLVLDDAVLTGWFDQVERDLGLDPHDAYLTIDGTAVRVEPEVEGTTIDRLRAREVITGALSRLDRVFAPLPVTPWIARVRAGDLEEAKARVEQALERPVDVGFEGRTWSIAPEDFGRFIVQGVAPDPALTGPAAVVVDVDEGALVAWLNDRFAAEVNRDPVNAEVGWNGERLIVLDDSVDGIRLRPKSFARNLAASFFGGHEQVPFPVSVTPPPVRSDNLDALGITTLLARGDSNYDSGGGAERDHNIEIGAGLLNGTLVPPHSEFSFNHAIGEITADKGYIESSVVEAERVGRDIGGGICQVSTTVFRAALLAGLPITEWWPHTYQILQYEHDGWGPGFDASILQPEGDPFGGSDFKFLNPTDSWMLVEAWTTGIYVVVNIYGPDLGYDVQFSETYRSEPIEEGFDQEVINYDLPPGTIRQTEYEIEGREVSFTRWVYDREGKLIEEREFYTRFKGRGDLYQVSPDMAGRSPVAA